MDRLGGLARAAMRKPQTAADHVADILREAVAEGSLKAGTPLRQDELAARFGFSRMPVRDALRLLEAEGIVSIHPTRGAFVASMDAGEPDASLPLPADRLASLSELVRLIDRFA